jgi:alkylation response protein AidB-like acyl-CoA dehydrogenase
VTGEFGAALRDFLSAYAKPVVPPEDTDVVWTRLCGELGLAGLLVPEEHGGLGFGPAELIEVSTELGRAVVGGPFVASAVVAATVLSMVDPGDELLAGIASGAVTPTLVHVPFASVGADSVAPVLAAPSGPLLVPFGPVLARVEAPRTELRSLDLSRPAFRIDLGDAPATVLARGEVVGAAVRRAEEMAWIALGAECLGVAAHALELTVEHARTRWQFGRPIGSFQAYQHHLADLAVRLEVARSAAEFVVRNDGSRAAAHAFAATAAEAAVTITTEAIQLHGGIGFTWEYPAHVLLRRAHSAAVLAGTPAQHRRALFALIPEEE